MEFAISILSANPCYKIVLKAKLDMKFCAYKSILFYCMDSFSEMTIYLALWKILYSS